MHCLPRPPCDCCCSQSASLCAPEFSTREVRGLDQGRAVFFPKDLLLRIAAAAAAKTPKPNGLRSDMMCSREQTHRPIRRSHKSTYLPILPTLQMETNDGSAFRQEMRTSRSIPRILNRNPWEAATCLIACCTDLYKTG